VLLDNMDIATLTEAVQIARSRVVLEASGRRHAGLDCTDRIDPASIMSHPAR